MFNFQRIPFPEDGTDFDHIAWFKNTTNLDFSEIHSKTYVETYASLCELIVDITGLGDNDVLHAIFETNLKVAEHAKKGEPGWSIKKPDLVNKVFADIEEVANEKEYTDEDSIVYHWYRVWAKAALIAYAPREINIARRKATRPVKVTETSQEVGESLDKAESDMETGKVKKGKSSTIKQLKGSSSRAASLNAKKAPLKKLHVAEQIASEQQHHLAQDSEDKPGESSKQAPQALSPERKITSNEPQTMEVPPFEHAPPLGAPGPQDEVPDFDHRDWAQDKSTIKVSLRAISLRNGIYMPLAVTGLAKVPVSRDDYSELGPNLIFDPIFLRQALGVEDFSPGCFNVYAGAPIRRLFPNIKTYRLLAPTYDPLVPQVPGHHGAQIAFPVRPEVCDDGLFPVFLESASGPGYRYLGMYRHPSTPDYLGRSEMMMLPLGLMMRWSNWLLINPKAKQMAEKLLGKKIEELIDTNQIHPANQLRRFFTNSDFGPGPKLRLIYEYLEFVTYQSDFYDCLIDDQYVWMGGIPRGDYA